MGSVVNQFTSRQYMIKNDFEFYHYRDAPNLVVEYHSHDFYEVYFFISGKVTYIIEGKSYFLKPGDIILINNKEFHNAIIESDTIYERYVIWINPDYVLRHCTNETDLSMCFESTSKRKYNLLRPGAEGLAHIKNIVSRLEKANNRKGFGSDILMEANMMELVVFLNRAYMDTNDEDIEVDIEYNEKISNIISYINSDLTGDLSLEDLSTKFFTSKYHLLREFKKNTGYTLHYYIQKKRLILARSLLKSNLKVSEVSMKCGFGDYTNFNRAFKKEYGVSPKNYLKSLQ
ncbi:MAG: AraC family transcriptional regulator [Clostridiales bacterium]|nr:AraC family transcriptional regulator [Clostridiales bacterium]